MNAIIKTYAELESEKLRLQASLALQAGVIREDLSRIREELKPLHSLLMMMRKFVSGNRNRIHLGSICTLIFSGLGIFTTIVLVGQSLLAVGASTPNSRKK